MPLQPPRFAGQVPHYVHRPSLKGSQFGKATVLPNPGLQPSIPQERNTLQQLGISAKQAQNILDQLNINGDQPYHAGKLGNGNVYLVTRQDQLYYGSPAHLEQVTLVDAYRTKCAGRQTRYYQTPEGLFITVFRKGNQQWAAASISRLGIKLPLPHLKQMAFPKQPSTESQVFPSKTLLG
jgi:hypothetical protein